MRSSSLSSPALRGGALAATAFVLAGALSACSSETTALEYIPPTMAPEQSVDEACNIAGSVVDGITLEVEEQIQQGLDQAAADLAAGRMPQLNMLSGSLDDAVAKVQQEVHNTEVGPVLLEVRRSLQSFSDIQTPENLLGVPGYLAAFTTELNNLIAAGGELRDLCGPSTKTEATP